jgi:AraC-like DNA-binding protein
MESLSLRRYSAQTTSHRHDHAQLVLPLDGPLEIEVAGAARRLQPGWLCVIAPGERHDFSADPALPFLTQDAHWLPPALLECPFRPLNGDQRRYLAFMRPLLERGQAPLGMGELWLRLLGQGRGISPRLNRVLVHMDAHLDQPLPTAELAAKACLGISRFNQLFASEMGTSPALYLQRRRLERAQDLLRLTDLAIGEVAARVGYQSQAAFSQRFIKVLGQTPSAWRRLHGGAGLPSESGEQPGA